ncbi:hypothetical protein MVEN_00271600 [Mycena venus]|uniref:Uncharacterized protein n=1 Tax=Mycena venus TaxID=2733690 RepID=A0A8H6YYJ8_9AGAR|nr:hypothetical protein MVEN_00271600 [Mycena venus]
MVPARGIAIHTLLVLHGGWQAYAAVTNRTIDDTDTKFWSFFGPWSAITPSTPCSTCRATPDPEQAHNRTWHDGFGQSGAFTFQGSAVYIYGIDFPDSANMTFNISNSPHTSFHYYTGNNYVYNSLFFSSSGLDPTTTHNVTWLFTQPSGGGKISGLLDYALVTVDQEDNISSSSAVGSPSILPSSTSTSSPNPIKQKSKSSLIVASVVGVIGGLALLSAAFIYQSRRQSKARSKGYAIEPYRPHSPSNSAQPFLWGTNSYPVYPGEGYMSSDVSPLPVSSGMISSLPITPSAKGTRGMAQDPHRSASAHARDLRLEERLRNLEELVALQPPAYH